MKMQSPRDLFEMELRYAYDCEQKLIKKSACPMIIACSSAELRQGLQQHLQETQNQVSRTGAGFLNGWRRSKDRQQRGLR